MLSTLPPPMSVAPNREFSDRIPVDSIRVFKFGWERGSVPLSCCLDLRVAWLCSIVMLPGSPGSVALFHRHAALISGERGSVPSSSRRDLRVAWLCSLMHFAFDFFLLFFLDFLFWIPVEVASYWNSVEVVSREFCNVACISA